MPIRNRLVELHPEITAWRRELHQHPELLYDTQRTSAFVAAKLRAFGCDEVVEGIGRTGVVGVIHGRQTGSGSVVGLRADMDALPIFETTGLDYASQTPGKMHACGHDGHTAMLLGAARYLTETRNFDGSVAVIFQPAEEGGAGGKAMVDDGLIDRFSISEVYGMHNEPGRAAGTFSIRPGHFYAAMDTFEIQFVGKGGHAAMPHETLDTLLMACNAVMSLQSIVSRNNDPIKALVVSITSFRSESEAFNVIPERVTLRGTLRCFEQELRDQTKQRICAIVEHTAQAYGGQASVDWHVGYPPMINDEAETEFASEAARRVCGSIELADQTMGGEDFAFILQASKGAYIQIGNGDSARLHHPSYDFNDEVIPAGVSYWVELVEARLPVSP